MKQIDPDEAKARMVAGAQQSDRPPPNFGFWDHLGWTLPADFDDPDPEVEALFCGDGTV